MSALYVEFMINSKNFDLWVIVSPTIGVVRISTKTLHTLSKSVILVLRS